MATPKTWTATDITKDQPINIFQEDGGIIRFSQGYQFLDSNNEIIMSLGNRDQSIEINFNTLPQVAKDAILVIQNYLYNNALAIEGME